MVRDLIIRNERLAEPFDFHILAVILADRNRRVDHLRNDHHFFFELCLHFSFPGRELIDPGIVSGDLFFHLFGFLFKALSHEFSDFLGNFVFIGSQRFHFRLDVSVFSVQSDHFVNQWELLVLIFLSDILFYCFRVLTNKFNVQHYFAPLLMIPYNLSSSSSEK